jgi:hypothetical protein
MDWAWGSTLWFGRVVPLYGLGVGFTLWIGRVVPLYGLGVWFHFMDWACGSTLWIGRGIPLYGLAVGFHFMDWAWGSKLMKRKILASYEMLGRDSMLDGSSVKV